MQSCCRSWGHSSGKAGAVPALLSLASTRHSSNNLLTALTVCVIQGLREGFCFVCLLLRNRPPQMGASTIIPIYFAHGPWGDQLSLWVSHGFTVRCGLGWVISKASSFNQRRLDQLVHPSLSTQQLGVVAFPLPKEPACPRPQPLMSPLSAIL